MAFLNGQEVKDVEPSFASGGGCGQCHRSGGPVQLTSAPPRSVGERWQEGSRPNLGLDLASLRLPNTANPVVVIGDMAEDGFRRDVPKLVADAGNIQLEVRLCRPTKPSTCLRFPQLDRWAWGGQATVRIGQLRQDGDDGAKKLFRDLLMASQPTTILQSFVQSRPDLLGRDESSVLGEVANTHRQWSSLRRFNVRGLPVLILDGRLALRSQIKMRTVLLRMPSAILEIIGK